MIDANTACPDNLPPAIWAALRQYALNRKAAGNFVMAVLTNNLREAVTGADPESLAALPDIVGYCYWELPGNCWGSVSEVEAWLENERTGDAR